MSTANTPVYEWNDLPWKAIEKRVFKLQKRIYRASQRGDRKTVHRLQRLLMKSWSAKCLAVRKVTQDNQGKKTAGVDGVKALTPPARRRLVHELHITQRPRPSRRVWIPKPNSNEQRPLGIPTIRTRAEQTLAKLALEPEWEATFEPNSYGFRPGRSCHDAIDAIYLAINRKPKYILDADIEKCFDRINHTALLAKLHTFPTLRRAIKAWLQSGVIDGTTVQPTTEGTPQGGPLSPLLANIALHGLETVITTAFPYEKRINGSRQYWQPTVIRYADDFVVLHQDRAVIEHCQQIAIEWLAGMGLRLKASKTRITHTLNPENGAVGCDFLGFQVRHYRVGKTHTGKSGGYGRPSTPLGFKTIITPSSEALKKHSQILKETIRKARAWSQDELIRQLNPIIRGWTHYYATQASKRAFSKMSHLLYHKLRSWARHRHPRQSCSTVKAKYWRHDHGKWTFITPEGRALHQHHETPIKRHIKVAGRRSPYDGDWVYWSIRRNHHPDTPPYIAALLRKQQGCCAWCGLRFRDGDLSEVDHILPKARGGQHRWHNWQLIHRHCHDQKTVSDFAAAQEDADDNSQAIEEPDEANVSRPVLKPSDGGDPIA